MIKEKNLHKSFDQFALSLIPSQPLTSGKSNIQETNLKILHLLAKASNDIILVFKTNPFHLTYINQEASLNLGYPLDPEKFISLFPDVVHEDDWTKLQQKLTSFTNSHFDTIEFEIRLITSDNRLCWHKFRCTKSELTNQEECIICVAQNINDNKIFIEEYFENQKYLQMALEASGMGIWSYDPISKIAYCDDKTLLIFETDRETFNDEISNLFLKIHREDRAEVVQKAIQALKEKASFECEFRIKTPDEKTKFVVVTGQLVTDTTQAVTRITGVCKDITDKREAELNITKNTSFLKETQHIAKIASFDWDLTIDKISYTDEFLNILDYSASEEISIQSFLTKVYPDDLPLVTSNFDHILKKGYVFDLTFRIFDRSNNLKYIHTRGKAIKDRATRTVHLKGTFQDVTDRKNVELEVKTKNLLIHSILNNLPVVIFTINKEGVIQNVVGNELSKLGLTLNNINKTIEVIDPKISLHIKEVLQSKGNSTITEEHKQDDERLHFFSYCFYEPNRDMVIGFCMDVTTQKKTEAAYEQEKVKNQELARMNKVMDTFVHAVAHDLKSPIHNLELVLNLLEYNEDPEERKRYFNTVTNSVNRLKKTIDGLIEVIEIQSSNELSAKELCFHDTVSNVLLEFSSKLKAVDGKITTDFKGCCAINYNEAFLTSIFKNLISNAIKYSSPERKPEILLTTEILPEGFILLTVQDNGIGINLEKYGKSLFKPFKRFTKVASGTGVGLHLIKSMVEKNGGDIQVESELNKGCTFYCYLKPYEC